MARIYKVIDKETYEKLCRTDTEKTKTNSADIIIESLPLSIKSKSPADVFN